TWRSSAELSRRPQAATAPRKTASAAQPNAANVAQGWSRAMRPTRLPVIASAVSRAPSAGSAASKNRAAPCASFPTGRNLGIPFDATPDSLRNDQDRVRELVQVRNPKTLQPHYRDGRPPPKRSVEAGLCPASTQYHSEKQPCYFLNQ